MSTGVNMGSRCCSSSSGTSSSTPTVRTAGVIIIGDEILKGQVLDTNSHFICKSLYAQGVKVSRISVIGDGIEEIAHEVRKFSSRYQFVFTTGGIGPTHDDQTYAGVALAFSEPLLKHPEMSQMVDLWLGHRGYDPSVMEKMCTLPKSSELIFDPAKAPMQSFPIVLVRNVYVFPGIPQFTERMFPRLEKLIFATKNENEQNAKFHFDLIYVAKDEMSITPQINEAVEKFKDLVTFGSYPVIGNLYYSTRLTMDSLQLEHVQNARDFLVQILPEGSVVQGYDDNPVASAATKVYAMSTSPKNKLQGIVKEAVEKIEQALDKYGLENLAICFNGGKDCTALLHLVYAVIQKKMPGQKFQLQNLYIQGENPFPEMEAFIVDASSMYNLKTWTYKGPIRDGLQKALEEHPNLKGVLMGTRRSDPYGADLDFFQMTDAKWPQVMRISPMLNWSFSDVWSFLRCLSLPYCPLYDQGYTSIGNRNNTVPNPALEIQTKDGEPKYRPAYTLIDPDTERTGRQ